MRFPELEATREAYGDALVELGSENPNVVVLDADTSVSTRTQKFALKFPERFFNVGIAEQNLVGVAAGLALSGKIPYMSTYAVFAPGRCLDQIRNAVAYPNLNVKIVATHGGISVGEDGATHQALEDLSIMRAIPNMKVIVPADANATRFFVKKIAYMEGPFYVRLSRPSVPVIYDKDCDFTIGKGFKLQDGSDITIFACGVMVAEAMEAANQLKEKSVSARVIDMHTIKPIDEDLIVKAAEETQGIVTAEDHNVIGGLGSAVAEVLAEKHPTPIRRIGVRDTFGESGSHKELMLKYGLTANNIAQAALNLISRRK